MSPAKNKKDSKCFQSFIGPHHEGQYIYEFLSKRFTYHTKDQWKVNIQKGEILLNGEKTDPKYVLRNGDLIQYYPQNRPEPKVPQKHPVIFEDEDLLIVNKAPHIPVHPVGRYLKNTLINVLKAKTNYPMLFLSHRLDRETSGLCVLSKTPLAKDAMYWQFFDNKVKKTYWALVWGKPAEDQGLIDLPIGKVDPDNPKKFSKIRIKQIIKGKDAKSAKTHFKVLWTKMFHNPSWRPPEWASLEADRDLYESQAEWPISLIECKPITGRTNQIRVHLAALGCGVVGDKLYDPQEAVFCKISDQKPVLDDDKSPPGPRLDRELKARLLMPAHALHAREIEFKHPRTNKVLKLQAPPPKYWSDFL